MQRSAPPALQGRGRRNSWKTSKHQVGASVQTSSLLEHFLCAHYVARHCARHFVVVQSLCRVQLFAAPWTTARQDSLSSTIFQSLLKFIFIESMMSSNHIILCCPLLLSIFPSIRVFSNESALRTRWPKYWSFSFSIGPSNDYSELISSRTDWFASDNTYTNKYGCVLVRL